MLDFWGVVAVVVAIAVNLTAIATIMPLSLAGRLALAALSGAWVGGAAALAAAGELADATSRLIPLIGVLFAAPLLLMALWVLISARLRTMLFEIPMPLLIGLNIMRVFGLFFVLLASAGPSHIRPAGAMSLPAWRRFRLRISRHATPPDMLASLPHGTCSAPSI
jgi:hypothetical protein